jgi:RNA polymerase sigma-70 factor (ECF subfamily)
MSERSSHHRTVTTSAALENTGAWATGSANARMYAIHQTFNDVLQRFLLRLAGGTRNLAEDLFQETMLRTWRSLDAVPSDHDGARRWLFVVARRVAIDHARRRKTLPQEVGPAHLDTTTTGDDTSNTVIANDTIRHAFTRLTPAQQMVLREIYLRGRRADALAAELNIPTGTVKSRAHYALTALRNALADEG